MSHAFLSTIALRRSTYALSPTSPIPDSRIQEIVSDVLLKAPSAFNTQTTRVILLLGDGHRKLWDIVSESLIEKIGKERYDENSKEGIEGKMGAYGTVLFFEDTAVVKEFERNIPSYADKFAQWSEHTSGIHQYAVWVALTAEGLGANLQHYNPLIDKRVAEAWNVPSDWSLKSQLVFGGVLSKPDEKEKKPLEGRLFVYNS